MNGNVSAIYEKQNPFQSSESRTQAHRRHFSRKIRLELRSLFVVKQGDSIFSPLQVCRMGIFDRITNKTFEECLIFGQNMDKNCKKRENQMHSDSLKNLYTLDWLPNHNAKVVIISDLTNPLHSPISLSPHLPPHQLSFQS